MKPLRTMQELENDMAQNAINRWSGLCERAIETGNASDASRFAQAAMRAARLLNEGQALTVQAEQATEPMLKLATPAEDRTILIEATERGYRAKLPYKPCDSAIKGFHQAKMVWQRGTSVLDVYWTIPADRLDFAKEIIGYWFTESPSGDGLNRQGKACYRMEMAETKAAEIRRCYADEVPLIVDMEDDLRRAA